MRQLHLERVDLLAQSVRGEAILPMPFFSYFRPFARRLRGRSRSPFCTFSFASAAERTSDRSAKSWRDSIRLGGAQS